MTLADLATRCLGLESRRARWARGDHPPPGICFFCGYDMRLLQYPCLCPECGSWPDTRWETPEPAVAPAAGTTRVA